MFTPGIDSLLREQENMNSLTRRDIEQMQLCKLNELLAREHLRGGFYKNLPLRVESMDELQELPLTTREDVAGDPGAFLLCSQRDVVRIISQETSGTTGNSMRVFYTQGDLNNTVRLFEAGLGELIYPGSRTLICMPFSGPNGLGELICEAITGLGAEPIPLGSGIPYLEVNRIIKEQKPDTYVGIPVELLSYLRIYGAGSLKRALISGDSCPGSVIKGITNILGPGLFPHYGSREMGLGGAITCQAHGGMHLRENHVIAEVVDAKGRQLPPGEYGELVITTIGMEAMPLIRYRTGDRTRIIPGKCPCGSEALRLDKVRRIEDGGMYELDEAMFEAPELIDYYVEDTGDRIVIHVLTKDVLDGENITESAEKLLHKKIETDIITINDASRPSYLGKRKINFFQR